MSAETSTLAARRRGMAGGPAPTLLDPGDTAVLLASQDPEGKGMCAALLVATMLADGDPDRVDVTTWLDNDTSGLAEPFEIAALGLPVIFAQKLRAEGGRTATRTVSVAPDGPKIDRRASPLWLRVYADDAGRWRLRSLAMLCEWLPHDTQLTARTRGRRPEQLAKPTQDQVNTFLRYWFE